MYIHTHVSTSLFSSPQPNGNIQTQSLFPLFRNSVELQAQLLTSKSFTNPLELIRGTCIITYHFEFIRQKVAQI